MGVSEFLSDVQPGVPAGVPDVSSLSDLVPARDRAIPVEPALAGLFPDAGLRRGHVIGCGGGAARSLAFALVARPVTDGAWLAVVGLPDLGIEAAVEHGVPADRLVAVDADTPTSWAERIAAAADGFELILAAQPRGADRVMRKLRQRLQARGGVLLLVPPGRSSGVAGIGCDVDLTTSGAVWVGIGAGHGRLVARRVTIEAAGRRMPRPVAIDCWLPGPDGRVDVVQTGAQPLPIDDRRTVSRAS